MDLLAPLSAAAILFSGCAETDIYEGGRCIARIQADADNVTIRTKLTYFHADKLNHSTATAAGGTAATGITGAVGAAAAGVLVTRP